MTNLTESKTTDTVAARVGLPADALGSAAVGLARGGRWRQAFDLLDTADADDPRDRALLALAAAKVALESDWFGGTYVAADRLSAAQQACADVDLDPGSRWDLDFLRLRHEYFDLLLVDGTLLPGPQGKDPESLAGLEARAEELSRQAPDELRQGWAQMYLGLIEDNLFARRDEAPAHYTAALRAGEAGDDLLAREALRHLGDHDHDDGDHASALARWGRATALGAGAGAVTGTLSQQLLLAVLARDSGDEAGCAALAREIARWATALGAVRIAAQANGLLDGTDPTAPPEDRG